MPYKVVPFMARVLSDQGTGAAAKQLEDIINNNSAEGWAYRGVENISIIVTTPGAQGCFGIGARPEMRETIQYDMVVFEK